MKKTTITTPTSSANCGSGWEEDKSSVYCYQFHRNRVSWKAARTACIKAGGNLASIHSTEQQFYITGRLHSITDQFFWIGANDQTTEGGWKWTDKTPFAFMNWDANEPDKTRSQNCVGMVPSTGKWNDLKCSLKYGYICLKTGKRTMSTIGTTTSPISAPSGKKWGCPPNWKGFRGSCYGYFVPKPNGVTWKYATTYCQALVKAELVSITDQVENDFVYSNIPRSKRHDMWLGLNDRAKENTFVWADGTPVTFTNWAPNEPNNYGNEDCAVLYTGKYAHGHWNDDDCSDASSRKKLVVCKKSKAFLSTTSTALTKGCPKSTVGFQDKCYSFSETARTFSNAEKYCKQINGHLATVPNNLVQAYLTSLMSRKTSGKQYWIGLSSTTATQNAYTWTSGSTVQYTNWVRGHTGKETNTCVAMQTSIPSGLWTNHGCTSTRLPLLCEIHRVGFTAPPTHTTVSNLAPCPTGWLSKGGTCYKAFGSTHASDLLTWGEARTKCGSFATGGTLASIGSLALSSWLIQQIKSSGVDRTNKFWIGLNDRSVEGGYEWTDGSPSSWTHWGNGEPNDSGKREDCVEINLNSGTGYWNDAYCYVSQNYICQFPRGSVLNTPMPTVIPGPTGGSCGNANWTYFKATKKCYFISPETGDNAQGSWFQAQRFCHAMGAELTSINSEDENGLIVALVSKHYKRDVWIGMNDIDSDTHRWVDKSPAVFWGWSKGEPNNYDGLERCVEMTPYGLWNDEQCSDTQGYICKRNSGYYHPTIQPVTTHVGGCTDGYTTHKLATHCYKAYLTVNQTFDTAVKSCKAVEKGGTLATIHNEFENKFITTLLVELKLPAWIGFLKPYRQRFTWIDNSETSYVNWGEGYSSYIYSRAGAVMLNGAKGAGKWSVRRTYMQHPFICQSPKITGISTPTSSSTGCHSHYTRHGDACYKYVDTPFIWTYAEKLCVEEGGHLMSISDGFESAYLYVLSVGIKLELWTGLKYDGKSKLYKWSNGWPFTFAEWGKDQPTNLDGEGCVSSNSSENWKVSSCLRKLPFVCKVNLTAPPVSSGFVSGYCPTGFTSKGHNCYYVESSITKSRARARTDCKSRGATLASILTDDEESVIKALLGSSTQGFWIGLMPGVTIGYTWDDMSPVNYNRLQNTPGSSVGQGAECVKMGVTSNYWSISDCSSKYGFVCKTQQKAYTTPTPTNTNIPQTASGKTPSMTISTSTTPTTASTSTTATTTTTPTTTSATPSTTTSAKPPTTPTTSTTKMITTSTTTQTSSSRKNVPTTSSTTVHNVNKPQAVKKDKGLSGGGVAGVVIGVLAVVVIAVLIVFMVRRGHADSWLRNRKTGSPPKNETKGFDNILYESSGDMVPMGSMQPTSDT